MQARPSAARPELSVIVPTYGRPALLEKLLQRLSHQTLAPERFEVVAVDDGSPEPIALDAARHPFACTLLRQQNAGPGAARNRALEHCRAPLVLILNDDAIPAPDLLAKHLEIHAQLPPRTAVLGSFHFDAGSMRRPFVRLLDETDLLFDFPRLRHGELHDWKFFWTCNLSLPLEALREVGGFDAGRFREAIVEDVELGYRLEQRGWRVLYREDARAQHCHDLSPDAWLRRMVRLGVNTWRMAEKHGPALLGLRSESQLEPFLQSVQTEYEIYRTACERTGQALARMDEEYGERALPAAVVARTYELVRKIGQVPYARGLLLGANGTDPEERLATAPPADALVSLVVVSYNALAKTQRCLEALRSAREGGPPCEILFVDNGSSDGSAEFLAAQPDVTLIRNAANLGAPRARNLALTRARGEWIAFLDNDAIVSPGWLARLRRHAWNDPRVGCVCPVSDRAAHHQQISYEGGDDLAAIRAFAARRAAEFAGRAGYKTIFTSFCVLVSRAVIERIGGFDARFSPWGFEDDDFSLRAHLAGFRSRLALDVFVRHESYGDAGKSERHARLLRRNWRRFARKWGKGELPPYGEYGFLAPVVERRWSPEELFVPLESGDDAPAAERAKRRQARRRRAAKPAQTAPRRDEAPA